MAWSHIKLFQKYAQNILMRICNFQHCVESSNCIKFMKRSMERLTVLIQLTKILTPWNCSELSKNMIETWMELLTSLNILNALLKHQKLIWQNQKSWQLQWLPIQMETDALISRNLWNISQIFWTWSNIKDLFKMFMTKLEQRS